MLCKYFKTLCLIFYKYTPHSFKFIYRLWVLHAYSIISLLTIEGWIHGSEKLDLISDAPNIWNGRQSDLVRDEGGVQYTMTELSSAWATRQRLDIEQHYTNIDSIKSQGYSSCVHKISKRIDVRNRYMQRIVEPTFTSDTNEELVSRTRIFQQIYAGQRNHV